MSFISRIITVALLTAAVAASGIAQEKYLLQYKYQKGKIYRYHDLSTSNTTQEMMGKEMKVSDSTDITVKYDVTDVAGDGSMTIVNSPEKAVSAMKMPMRDTTMELTGLIGKRSQLVLSPAGVVTGREILDTAEIAGMRGGNQRGLVKFHQFKDAPVAVGDKWQATISDTADMMGMKIINATNVDYTLSGQESKMGHNCLKLDYAGTTTVKGSGTMMGNQMDIDGTGKTSGTLWFDQAAGIVVFEDGTAENDMTLAMSGQQSMTIPMTRIGHITHALLEE